MILNLRYEQLKQQLGFTKWPAIGVYKSVRENDARQYEDIPFVASVEFDGCDHYISRDAFEFQIDENILKGFLLNRDEQIRKFVALFMAEYCPLAIEGTIRTFFIDAKSLFGRDRFCDEETPYQIYEEFLENFSEGDRLWLPQKISVAHILDDSYRLSFVFENENDDNFVTATGETIKANRSSVVFDVVWDEIRSLESEVEDRQRFYKKLSVYLQLALKQGDFSFLECTNFDESDEECPFETGELKQDEDGRIHAANDYDG